MWAGIAIYGFADHFQAFPREFLAYQGGLTGLTYVVDYVSTAWGVKRFKGSKAAAWGAVLGTLLIFVIGPWGILIGPFAGAVIAELVLGSELRQALQSGFGSFIGLLAGTLVKLMIVGCMIAWFLVEIS